ncbi:hypothetical protein POSPLADRAFT_1047980 [Postia placenta MAD-698-R-SB12]|uniref:Uncharacterized protein n=1 Tax=Postia placenta MAD-698-R-SB12 TaxID=670580 RepID=A0A1X6MW47_9APHY|nr:hypothetical protein POSPLADRAFT_1047980 [Postia placenta MAD-698-R-SB12]OSX60569.1 hypothetical protein POSPLADRAFT_1047980 [Postia placenta MAD-698-R-SB12]
MAANAGAGGWQGSTTVLALASRVPLPTPADAQADSAADPARPPVAVAALAPPELSRGFTPSPTPEQDPRTDGAVTPGPPSRSSSETEPHSASVSRTPSGSSLSSCASAGSTSLFDAAAPSVLSADTRVTTPAVSDAPPKSDDSEHEHEMITIVPIPQARRPRPRSIDLSSSSLAPRPVRRHSQPVPARSDEDWARDVRWLVPPPASPVRPPPSPHHAAPPHTPSPRRRSRPLHPDLLPPPGPALVIPAPHQLERHSFPDVPVVPQRPRTGSKARRPHSHRHSRGRMSALWEEDESECSTDVGASSAEVSRASTPAPVAAAEGYLSVHPGYGYEGRSATPPPGWPYTAGPGAGVGAGGSPTRRFMPHAMHRRASMSESELLQHLQVQGDTPPPSPGASPDSKLRDYARQHAQQHHRAMSTPLSSPSAPTTSPARPASTTGHGLSASLPTHALPAPAFAGSASAGYTGLTLPHASYTPKHGRPQRDGHVDLVRAGRAQSSMATVEVVRGAAASLPAGSPLTRTRTRLSRGFSLSISRGKGKGARRRSHSREPEREREREKGKERARDGATPAHLRGALPLPVVFTAHVPPPAFVPGSHVLVQVFAVGVDALDSLVVQEKAERRGGAGAGKRRGFVPGRSFVGRAVECGFEVSRDVCRKGDWVLGLLDVRKCGALAEFVLVERHRVVRSPQPRARSSYLRPPAPQHTRPHADAELALLPLCGLPAHRAVRTFADALAPRPGRGRERPRALILMGHDGPGAMALQMLGRKRAHGPEDGHGAQEDGHNAQEQEGRPSSEARAFGRRAAVEARLRAWGAEEVCVGDPLSVLERFVDEGRAFDAVLDTVGGVCVWEAAQRLLSTVPSAPATQSAPTLSGTFAASEDANHHDEREAPQKKTQTSYAQFTTLVGDTPSRPVPKAQDNLRSGLRSLRRAMSTSSPSKGSASGSGSSGRVFGTGGKAKAKRAVGYTWISVAVDMDEGEDVRDSLGAVVGMVEEGRVRPWLGSAEDGGEERVVPFEDAPEVFRRGAEGPVGVLKDGGTCAVKIGAY